MKNTIKILSIALLVGGSMGDVFSAADLPTYAKRHAHRWASMTAEQRMLDAKKAQEAGELLLDRGPGYHGYQSIYNAHAVEHNDFATPFDDKSHAYLIKEAKLKPANPITLPSLTGYGNADPAAVAAIDAKAAADFAGTTALKALPALDQAIAVKVLEELKSEAPKLASILEYVAAGKADEAKAAFATEAKLIEKIAPEQITSGVEFAFANVANMTFRRMHNDLRGTRADRAKVSLPKDALEEVVALYIAFLNS